MKKSENLAIGNHHLRQNRAVPGEPVDITTTGNLEWPNRNDLYGGNSTPNFGRNKNIFWSNLVEFGRIDRWIVAGTGGGISRVNKNF